MKSNGYVREKYQHLEFFKPNDLSTSGEFCINSKGKDNRNCILERIYYLRDQNVCVCAKSLQSCLTLYNTMDCSPPGSFVHGFSRQECWGQLPCKSLGGSQKSQRVFLGWGIFPIQGWNPNLLHPLHCRQILYH